MNGPPETVMRVTLGETAKTQQETTHNLRRLRESLRQAREHLIGTRPENPRGPDRPAACGLVEALQSAEEEQLVLVRECMDEIDTIGGSLAVPSPEKVPQLAKAIASERDYGRQAARPLGEGFRG